VLSLKFERCPNSVWDQSTKPRAALDCAGVTDTSH
jgi:hypothetical protein